MAETTFRSFKKRRFQASPINPPGLSLIQRFISKSAMNIEGDITTCYADQTRDKM